MVLTSAGLSVQNKGANTEPVSGVVSAKRNTLLLDNEKGVVILGGLNQGTEPWTTCILSGEKIKREVLHLLGENAVMYLENGLMICDFSDPKNLIYSPIPYMPEIMTFGDAELQKVESLDNVSVILLRNMSGEYAVVVLDLTNGINNARSKFEKLLGYSGAFGMFGLVPDIAFNASGAVLVDGVLILSPEEWGGEMRPCDDPDAIMPSCNITAPKAKLVCHYGSGRTLIRHSPDYHRVSSDAEFEGFCVDDFEYACRWQIAPYRLLGMVYNSFPADGGSLILEHQGEFFVSAIDKRDTPPPSKVDFLMMNAASGTVAKTRYDIIEKATGDYDSLISSGAYEQIEEITDALKPLLENGDENALALWQRIARDFPRGKAFMSTECDKARAYSEVTDYVLTLEPITPGEPFARSSAIGKIRFKYNKKWNSPAKLTIMNGDSMPFEFAPYRNCIYVTCGEGSDDGLFQGFVYSQTDEKGRSIPGSNGILIRIIDVRLPNCVFELYEPGLQSHSIFMRWSYHTLLMYIGNKGVFAIDFDKWPGEYTPLPDPIIPDIKHMHDVAFIGEHADELFTGENRWRLCYEILPVPARPFRDIRYLDMENALLSNPLGQRTMLLRNGFGNIWTERILAGR